MSVKRDHQIVRFNAIMRRHIEAEDVVLSDHDLVRAVIKRYEFWRGVPLIDPNE